MMLQGYPIVPSAKTPKCLGRLGISGRRAACRRHLRCSAAAVTEPKQLWRLWERPEKERLQGILLSQGEQQQRPPGFSRGDDSAAPPKRKASRLRRELVELAEGNSLEEGPLLDGATFHNLARQCRLDPRWHEQVTLLCKLGMTKGELRRLAAGHPRFFNCSVRSVRPKLMLLRTQVGLEDWQLCMLLLRFPRVVEYGVDHLRARIEFFLDLGLSKAQLQKMVVQMPSLLCSLSLEDTLKPRLELLQQDIGLPAEALPGIIARSPNILASADESLLERAQLLKNGGLSQEEMVKMMTAHPQVLSYSVAAMRGRFNFLHSLGLTRGEAAAVLARCPTVLSLSVEANLWPKVEYLTQQLHGTADSLVACPVYLTLSLQHRIVPRHRYWERLHGRNPKKPLPLSYLTWTDAMFAERGVQRPLEEYLDFKGRLWSGKPL